MAIAAGFNSRRFAAVATLAVLLLVGVLWIVWTSVAVSATGELVAQQREQLNSLAARAGTLGSGGGEAGAGELMDVYFPGDTQAIAAAEVQRTVDQIVGKAGGRVVESQILPVDADTESANRIDLRASFEADIDALQAALYEIESHLPIMMVRSMSVRSFVTAGSREPDQDNPVLQVSLVVSGYWTADDQ